MPNYRAPHIHSSEITPEHVWQSRRVWMKAAGASLFTGAVGSWPSIGGAASLATLEATTSKQFFTMEPRTPEKDAASYNNFYEFGTDKGDPVKNAHTLQTSPWKVRIEGEVASPKTFDLDDIRKLAPLEERTYRMRCVEGWSMVTPSMSSSLRTSSLKICPA